MSSIATEWQARAREQFELMLLNVGLAWKAEQDKLTSSVQAGAREHFASALNLGLRRLRAVSNANEIAVVVVELASNSAEKVALFLFRDGAAHSEASRNLGQQTITFAPNQAAAFQTAIETQDPVVAIATPSEISAALADQIGAESAERVFLYPLAVRREVKAVLFAAGNVQTATLELIAGMAALQLETVTAAPASIALPNELINIAGAQSNITAWDKLSPEIQSLHLKAQRKARLRVAEMQLEHPQAVQRGRAIQDIYSQVRLPIDKARDEFQLEFISAAPSMVDYLYLELIRGLAQGDDRLLGSSFPGPLK